MVGEAALVVGAEEGAAWDEVDVGLAEEKGSFIDCGLGIETLDEGGVGYEVVYLTPLLTEVVGAREMGGERCVRGEGLAEDGVGDGSVEVAHHQDEWGLAMFLDTVGIVDEGLCHGHTVAVGSASTPT